MPSSEHAPDLRSQCARLLTTIGAALERQQATPPDRLRSDHRIASQARQAAQLLSRSDPGDEIDLQPFITSIHQHRFAASAAPPVSQPRASRSR